MALYLAIASRVFSITVSVVLRIFAILRCSKTFSGVLILKLSIKSLLKFG
jgi:hypothetical protein